MTDWFKKSVQMAYFPSKDGPLKDWCTKLRGISQTIGLSSLAKEKLEWVIFYHTVGKKSAVTTASYFGITKKLFTNGLAGLTRGT